VVCIGEITTPQPFTESLGKNDARRIETLMRSLRSLSTLAAATAIIAIAVPNAVTQASRLNEISAAAVASAAYPSQQDAAPVQAALNQFDSAIASHNVGLLLAVGIQPARARGWQKFFRENPEASVRDDCPQSALAISGDTANWYCTETATIVSERRPVSFQKVIRFTFTRSSGVWMISDRR
jgi:hypothetical protein